jgi:hypothetical protein
MDQGLEHACVQYFGSRNGYHGEYGAVKPPDQKAGQGNGCAQHGGQNQRTRSDKPVRETLIAAEPGNDRGVDGMIEPVRFGLVSEQHAEHGHEDRAAGQ